MQAQGDGVEQLAPFQLQPLAVARVWGGRGIASSLGRALPAGDPVGESWEIHGSLPVLSGPYAGQTLDQLLHSVGRQRLLGSWAPPGDDFPLLAKWLDCQDWLSLQVHPDDALARELEGPGFRGKTEAWLFYEVGAEAEVIHGWKEAAPALAGLDGEGWVKHVRRFTPRQGEWAFTSAGTVHALGPGLLVFEIQQSSDLTYRIYDWGRVGLDGQPRETHLEKSVAAAERSAPLPTPEVPSPALGEVKVICPFFCVEQISGAATWTCGSETLELITALDADLELTHSQGTERLARSASLIVPAGTGSLSCAAPADARWLRIRLCPPQA